MFIGLALIVVAVLTQSAANFYMAGISSKKFYIEAEKSFNKQFWWVFSLTLFASLLAAVAFVVVALEKPCLGIDENQLSNTLTSISILVAGVVTGNFAYQSSETSTREKILNRIILILNTTVLYGLFTLLILLTSLNLGPNGFWLTTAIGVCSAIIIAVVGVHRIWDHIEI